VTNLQIKGYKAQDLDGKQIYISDNEGMDLAFNETGREEEPHLFCETGKVMQECLEYVWEAIL